MSDSDKGSNAARDRGAAPVRPNPAARRLQQAAIALLASRGLANVSMREICLAAGNGNNSAITYHFSGRAGLVDSIAGELMAFLLPRYVRLLERLEALPATALTDYEIGLSLNAPLFALYASKPGGKDLTGILARFIHEPGEALDTVYRATISDVYRRFEKLTLLLAPGKEPEQVWYHISHLLMATVDGLTAIPAFTEVDVADQPGDRYDLILHYNDFVTGGLLALSDDRPGLDHDFWRGEIDP